MIYASDRADLPVDGCAECYQAFDAAVLERCSDGLERCQACAREYHADHCRGCAEIIDYELQGIESYCRDCLESESKRARLRRAV